MPSPTALVTGGNGGIGAAACRALAAHGARVWVAGRRLEACEIVVSEIELAGGAARAVALDVTDPAAIARAVAATSSDAPADWAPVTWLVNNAGIAETAAIGSADADEAHVAKHLDVNLHGPRRLTEAFLPGMVAAGGGRVVQVASSAALQGYAFVAAYVASKHALLGWSRSAALELAKRGVAVNTVCPHFVDSPMTRRGAEEAAARSGKSADAIREAYAGFNPSGALVTEGEVAAAILDLCTTGSTGAVLELPGGGERRTVEAGRELPS
jgi:NAD(P)-dependent dehydrogenase (short-subunit alcohol dehydrogenase family)